MRVLLSSIQKILLNTDRRSPSFFNKLLLYGLQIHFSSIVTPRHLHDCTRSTSVPFICKSTSSNINESMVLLPASMSLVFFTFMVSLFSLYQSHILLYQSVAYFIVPVAYFLKYLDMKLKLILCVRTMVRPWSAMVLPWMIIINMVQQWYNHGLTMANYER